MYKKTQLEKMHRIQPLCFLDFRKRNQSDFPCLFNLRIVGPTGFSFFLRIEKTTTDWILCVLTRTNWRHIAYPPLRMELALRLHLGKSRGAGVLTQ